MKLEIGMPVFFDNKGVDVYGYIKSINGGMVEVMTPNKNIFNIGFIWINPIQTPEQVKKLQQHTMEAATIKKLEGTDLYDSYKKLVGN